MDHEHFYSACSCPYGNDCKHGVATSLVLVDYAKKQQDLRKGSEANVLDPNRVSKWLLALQSQIQPRPKVYARGGAPRKVWYPFCLINTKHALMLGLVDRYLKADGEWGQARIRYFYDTSGTSADERMISEFLEYSDYRTRQKIGGVQVPMHDIPLNLAGTIILAAVGTGYAVDAETLIPLERAERRSLTLQWEEQKRGFKLVASIEGMDESDCQIIPSLPPLYRYRNAIGPVECDVSSEFLRLISDMPEIPADQLDKVKAHIAHFTESSSLSEDAGASSTVIDHFVSQATLMSVYSKANGYLPALKASVAYGPIQFVLDHRPPKNTQATTELVEHEGHFYSFSREFESENECCLQLRGIGLSPYDFGGQQGILWVPCEIKPELHIHRWHKMLPKLEAYFKESDWDVVIDSSYQVNSRKAHLDAGVKDGAPGWFDLQLNLSLDGIACDTAEIFTQWLAMGAPENLPIKK